MNVDGVRTQQVVYAEAHVSTKSLHYGLLLEHEQHAQ